jgi:hypothetical protein
MTLVKNTIFWEEICDFSTENNRPVFERQTIRAGGSGGAPTAAERCI